MLVAAPCHSRLLLALPRLHAPPLGDRSICWATKSLSESVLVLVMVNGCPSGTDRAGGAVGLVLPLVLLEPEVATSVVTGAGEIRTSIYW